MERFGVQGVQFVLQIVLARILSPEDYGMLSMMIIFSSLTNIFIQNGFNTALVQGKDVTEEDYSSVFWVTMGLAVVMYTLLFVSAPWIAEFYKIPDIVAPFRVLSLIILPGAWNSVQLAIIGRRLDFRKVFTSNICAIIVSGVVGIICAYKGFGVWSLVIQNLLNILIACAVMFFSVQWKPVLVCNLKRIKQLISYGWKILVANLIDALYQDLSSLIIGKKYSTAMLGYYNRGKQFPQLINNSVNGAVQSVMLPAMAAKQKNLNDVKATMRNSIRISSFIMFPVMAGLIGVAEPLVELILTEKWMPCVPYLRLFCASLAVYPIHSCNLQAFNAIGKSDIYLKLEIIKKGVGIVLLILSVFLFDSIIAIALSVVLTSYIGFLINAVPNKKIFDYSYREQIGDVLPSMALASLMCAVVICVGNILGNANLIPVLGVEVLVGILIYMVTAYMLKVKAMMDIVENLKLKKADSIHIKKEGTKIIGRKRIECGQLLHFLNFFVNKRKKVKDSFVKRKKFKL
jgi:O-antigen/teichoic acid export membrane protein